MPTQRARRAVCPVKWNGMEVEGDDVGGEQRRAVSLTAPSWSPSCTQLQGALRSQESRSNAGQASGGSKRSWDRGQGK